MSELRVISENGSKQLEWIIPHFTDLTTERSPSFEFKEVSWHLKIEIVILWIDKKLASAHNVSLINETGHPCPVNCSISIKGLTGNLYATTTFTFTATVPSCYLISNFTDGKYLRERSSILLPSGRLTIVCKLEDVLNDEIIVLLAPEASNNLKVESPAETMELMELVETDILSKNLKDLFTNKDTCDVVLRVKDKEFQAHKLILIARSRVFAAMFQHDTSEKQTGVINIPDCDSSTFQEFLEYLYCGKLRDISFVVADQLYRTSHKYEVPELQSFCTKCMMKNLTEQNVCDAVILADEYDETQLFSKAQNFFNENFKKILTTSEWKNLVEMNFRLSNKLLIELSNSERYLDKTTKA